MNEPVIMNPSNWAQALSAIGSGLRYLDSIVLFDVPNVHLTVLGFDIAVFVFGIVWNTVGLWHYDFVDDGDDVPSDDSEIDIFVDDDDDYN